MLEGNTGFFSVLVEGVEVVADLMGAVPERFRLLRLGLALALALMEGTATLLTRRLGRELLLLALLAFMLARILL